MPDQKLRVDLHLDECRAPPRAAPPSPAGRVSCNLYHWALLPQEFPFRQSTRPSAQEPCTEVGRDLAEVSNALSSLMADHPGSPYDGSIGLRRPAEVLLNRVL